jgi:hypothetical protein
VKPPKYEDTNLGNAAQCSICGCLVTDFNRHASFHDGLVRMLGIEVDD